MNKPKTAAEEWAAKEAEGWREEQGHIVPPGSTLAIVMRGLAINKRIEASAGWGKRRDREEEI